MVNYEELPGRVGKKEKSLEAPLVPMVQRLAIVYQDGLKFPLPLLVLKMDCPCLI